MDNEVVVEYQLEKSDATKVFRHCLPPSFKIQYFIPVFLILVGTYLAVIGGGLFVLIFGFVYVTYVILLMWWAPRRGWNKSPIYFKGQRRMVASDEGVVFSSTTEEIKRSWVTFERSDEWSDYYFLRGARNRVAGIIPKRSFTSPQIEAQFRALLRAHTDASLLAEPTPDGLDA